MPSEHDEQVAVFRWAEAMAFKHPELNLMYAIPNGGLRNIQVAAKLKKEGVRRGIPDVCLPISRHGFNALYIEMKKKKDRKSPAGKPTKIQIEKMKALSEAGNVAVVCVGADAAIDTIKNYIEG